MIHIQGGADGDFVLCDGDRPCGGARADFSGELTLLAVDAPDALLAEGLVRAVLSAGRTRGLTRAVCGNETLFGLLDKLGFEETTAGWEVDIAAFFARGCPSRQQ